MAKNNKILYVCVAEFFFLLIKKNMDKLRSSLEDFIFECVISVIIYNIVPELIMSLHRQSDVPAVVNKITN